VSAEVKGLDILLVDDLYRSGATMSAIAEALHASGASNVFAFASTQTRKMTKKVFIGGSRKITRLSEQLMKRLDQIVIKKLRVLIGDANGADKIVQAFFAERGYRNVQIFCSAGHCRNNLGKWEIKSVIPPHTRRDFEFFTAKDAVMAQEADVGLMLWDGQSSGTVVNAARLVAAGKPVVVYIAAQREFQTVKSRTDFEGLLSPCSPEIRQRIDRYVTSHAGEYTQYGMF
jgi:hypothetical protein